MKGGFQNYPNIILAYCYAQIVCTDGEFYWSSFLLAAASSLMNSLLGKFRNTTVPFFKKC